MKDLLRTLGKGLTGLLGFIILLGGGMTFGGVTATALFDGRIGAALFAAILAVVTVAGGGWMMHFGFEGRFPDPWTQAKKVSENEQQ